MPELPEVETIANGVDRRLRGDIILSTWFSSHRQPFKTPPTVLAQALAGRRIARVHRVGKHIVVDLEMVPAARSGPSASRNKAFRPNREALSPDAQSREGRSLDAQSREAAPAHDRSQWIIHLGMTGRLLVADPRLPLPTHTHAVLRLASGRELRFVDPRRFGRLALAEKLFTGPGSEPLTISADDFAALFRGRKLSIKAALLNQKLLHGVGNIYADESLFRARIRPTRIAGRLPRPRLDRLRRSLQSVLKSAIRAGGSSVSDYVDADGEAGFFQLRHCVYGREGLPCRVCGSPIRRVVLGGRGTHFCPHCQK